MHLPSAIVVLGCRVTASGQLSVAAAGRAARAARAYHDGIAPVVVASGGRRWGAVAEATGLGAALVSAGVPPEAVHLEMCSLTTWENAVYTAALLHRLHRRGVVDPADLPPHGSAPRVAVVTCAWHLPRALSNFRAAGFDAVGLPAELDGSGAWRAFARRFHERVSTELDARLRWPRGAKGSALLPGAARW